MSDSCPVNVCLHAPSRMSHNYNDNNNNNNNNMKRQASNIATLRVAQMLGTLTTVPSSNPTTAPAPTHYVQASP